MDYAARVQRGIIFLRTREAQETILNGKVAKVYPELKRWASRIDLEKLDLDSAYYCVLGQLYGGFMDGVDALAPGMPNSELCKIGFLAYDREEPEGLTAEWRRRLANMPERQTHG